MGPLSFLDLVRSEGIKKIEIPIIQRDYAQGRRDGETARIRGEFLDVLRNAVVDGDSVHLDFIYGEIKGDTLIPLDGQQRLTALFLLHWYLGARAAVEDAAKQFPALTYETRSSARTFCTKLLFQRP